MLHSSDAICGHKFYLDRGRFDVVSLGKMLIYKCISPTRSINGYPTSTGMYVLVCMFMC